MMKFANLWKKNKNTLSFLLLIAIIIIIIWKINFSQRRHYYYIRDYCTLTIWHEYIIFGDYNSFFHPKPDSNVDFIKLKPFHNHLIICFIDSTSFFIYSDSKDEITFSLHHYILNGLYCGRENIQEYQYLKRKQMYYLNHPALEIELAGTELTYIPHVNIFNDSLYTRIAYELWGDTKDSMILQSNIQRLIEYNTKELKCFEKYNLLNCYYSLQKI